jgi:cytochrome c-type biogenesis protein
VGMAATEPAKSIIMMIIYSIGLALPFLLMAIFTVWSIKFIQKAKKYMNLIEKFSGILLILVGIYFIFKGL